MQNRAEPAETVSDRHLDPVQMMQVALRAAAHVCGGQVGGRGEQEEEEGRRLLEGQHKLRLLHLQELAELQAEGEHSVGKHQQLFLHAADD